MAPHPVPEGYGSACNEGEIITQGTGGRCPPPRYEIIMQDEYLDQDYQRNGRDFSISDNIFDC